MTEEYSYQRRGPNIRKPSATLGDWLLSCVQTGREAVFEARAGQTRGEFEGISGTPKTNNQRAR